MPHDCIRACRFCGNDFVPARCLHTGTYCSRACRNAGYVAFAIEGFWNSLRQEGGCKVWVGGRNHRGYGFTSLDGIDMSTHRKAWILTYGPIPDGMSVLHHCDNPPCCEPTHLFLGTQSDNMNDMYAKGRRSFH